MVKWLGWLVPSLYASPDTRHERLPEFVRLEPPGRLRQASFWLQIVLAQRVQGFQFLPKRMRRSLADLIIPGDVFAPQDVAVKLHRCIAVDDGDCIRALAKRWRAPVLLGGPVSRELVNTALERGALQAIRALLECGFELSADAALYCRDVRALDLLLERGVDAHVQRVVLENAAAAAKPDIVERLIALDVHVSRFALAQMRTAPDVFKVRARVRPAVALTLQRRAAAARSAAARVPSTQAGGARLLPLARARALTRATTKVAHALQRLELYAVEPARYAIVQFVCDED